MGQGFIAYHSCKTLVSIDRPMLIEKLKQRHEEVKRIERTLEELAQLFNDVRGLRDRVSLCS
jgi:hypothetical protein